MGKIVSTLLVYGEKLSLCCLATTLTCCVMVTMVSILGLGIGLGYNHCFVDMKTRHRYVPAHYIYHQSPRERSIEEVANKIKEAEEIEDFLEGKHLLRGTVELPPELKINTNSETTTQSYGRNRTKLFKYNNKIIKSLEKIRPNFDILITSETYGNNSTDSSVNNNTASFNNSTNSFVYNNTGSHNNIEFKKSQEKIGTKVETIPIAGLNLIDLVTKLKDSGKNYSIQVIRH